MTPAIRRQKGVYWFYISLDIASSFCWLYVDILRLFEKSLYFLWHFLYGKSQNLKNHFKYTQNFFLNFIVFDELSPNFSYFFWNLLDNMVTLKRFNNILKLLRVIYCTIRNQRLSKTFFFSLPFFLFIRCFWKFADTA